MSVRLYLAPLASLILCPAAALAHPGHTHVGDPATHHGMEAALVLLAGVAFVWSLRRAGVWGQLKG